MATRGGHRLQNVTKSPSEPSQPNSATGRCGLRGPDATSPSTRPADVSRKENYLRHCIYWDGPLPDVSQALLGSQRSTDLTPTASADSRRAHVDGSTPRQPYSHNAGAFRRSGLAVLRVHCQAREQVQTVERPSLELPVQFPARVFPAPLAANSEVLGQRSLRRTAK